MNRTPARQPLSSSPYFYKKIVPVLWLLGCVYVVADAVRSGESPLFIIGTVVVLTIGFGATRLTTIDLADEVLDGGDHLVVRFGSKREPLLLRDIGLVKKPHLARIPRRIELVLAEPGTLGPVIAFIPRGFVGTKVMDDVVADLERRARIAHSN
jgi:hypothetical protein